MRKWVYLSLSVSLLLSSCSKNQIDRKPQGQELRLNFRSEPLSIDPRKPNDVTSSQFLKMCFDGLTRMGPDGELQLSLAESADVSEDQRIYTLKLRKSLWSDGMPVTAYDFEGSWKTMLDPLFPCEYASDLFILKNGRAAKNKKCSMDEVGVRALDEYTLRIELDHPAPLFLSILSTHAFYPSPQHITSKYPHWADKANPHYVTNGPFKLVEWKQSDHITLEKSETYWDSAHVKLDRIQMLLIEDENTELTMFDNGELDWAGSPLSTLPLDAMPALIKTKRVTTFPMAGVYFYILNTQDPLLKNVKLRRAFALAINRQELIDNVIQSGQSPATCFIPPALSPEKQYFQDNDVLRARRLFTEALTELQLTKEQLPIITLSYNTMNSHHKIAQAIQGQWFKAFGIHVALENKEWKVFLDEQRHGKFQIARMGGIANNYDPIGFLDRYRYLSSEENFSHWTNPRFTELLESADQTIDEALRTQLIAEAEQIFMDEMPVIPIYFYTGSYMKQPYVKGVYVSELSDVDLKWAYVEMQ